MLFFFCIGEINLETIRVGRGIHLGERRPFFNKNHKNMKHQGYIDYVLLNDNSVGITISGGAESKNYFVAKIQGVKPTSTSLSNLLNKKVEFAVHRTNETSVTDSIEILAFLV